MTVTVSLCKAQDIYKTCQTIRQMDACFSKPWRNFTGSYRKKYRNMFSKLRAHFEADQDFAESGKTNFCRWGSCNIQGRTRRRKLRQTGAYRGTAGLLRSRRMEYHVRLACEGFNTVSKFGSRLWQSATAHMEECLWP